MIWVTTIVTVGCIVARAQGQGKYGAPYKGPPVVPVILPGGFLADTREVAAAKEYHLNAVAKAAEEVRAPKGYYNPSAYKPPQKASYQPPIPRVQPEQQSQLYTEPKEYKRPSYPKSLKTSPRPAPVYEDEPSAVQDREYDEPLYREQEVYYSASSPRPDPMVTPMILDNGFIADTPQVTAAKEEHFAAVAKAQEAVAQAVQRAAAQQPAAPPRVAVEAPLPPSPQQAQQFRGYSEY